MSIISAHVTIITPRILNVCYFWLGPNQQSMHALVFSVSTTNEVLLSVVIYRARPRTKPINCTTIDQ